ncbi:unnamed protein product, partial [Iphiclides podalirius]
MIRSLLYFNLCFVVLGHSYPCSNESALNVHKRPIYEFSLRILDRVSQQTGGHFVFSPTSSWMQLTTLAEGARGGTWAEIWKVTGQQRKRCFRQKMRSIFNLMSDELKLLSRRCSVLAVDRLYNVKDPFRQEAERLDGVRVLSLDFGHPESAAAETNDVIDSYMDGAITEAVYPDDFKLAVMLLTDTTYFRSDWKYPFNRAYTTPQPFYSEQGIKVGEVNMMSQVAYFHLAEVPLLNAKVLEIPCSADERVSMLVFVPTYGLVSDIFYSLTAVRLATVFNMYKQLGLRLVNVKLPRFKIITEMDTLPELVYDMGAKGIFYPHLADLSGISDYGVHASLMSQIADIEVIEEGVTARSFAEFLVSDNETVDFTADRPFAFMIVDRKTELILFAGSYNAPALY